MTTYVIDDLYSFPDNYKAELAHYLDENPAFRQKMMGASTELADNLPELIAVAIHEQLLQTAKALFMDGLKQTEGQWKAINKLTEDTMSWCMNDEDLESIEYFQEHLLPLVKAIQLGLVQDEIEEWEKSIADYIDRVEDECEQYAYTRRNAWRKTVPQGNKYGLDPRDYHTANEYLEALNEEKYGWRNWYQDRDTGGLDPQSFETQDAFREAFNARLDEKRRKEREERQRQRQVPEHSNDPAELEDTNIYLYYGVALPYATHVYHYRTEDTSIKIGDQVIVPVGEREMKAVVVSVGQYTRMAVPYPVENTKFICRKIEDKIVE